VSKKSVHVVGTGTIGDPLISLLCKFKKELGVDQITFTKRSATLTDRPKVHSLMAKGAIFSAQESTISDFEKMNIQPAMNTDEALDQADVVIDCTPVGNQNKTQVYEKFLSNTKGFIAQGSEFGFGKMYARGINDETLQAQDDQFIQVVSCNTHNLSVLVKTLGMDAGQQPDQFDHARFVCIRRANDISQNQSFIPGPQVGTHSDEEFGTHHARDAHELFKTKDLNVKLFSSAMKLNTQYMHTVWFHIKTSKPITKDEVFERIDRNDLMALTHKNTANAVFSFGRDHGHYGRILNQTVIAQETVEVVDQSNIYGWCFTPQDGNSLLSSISATSFFLQPDRYTENIQCLAPYFFREV
jgi:glyceraldehyde-3-phosphate dehydrogenase (NAD(P))